MTFSYFTQGSAATVYRWCGQVYNLLMAIFIRMLCTKNYKNRL